jgi:hypothetical protein
MIKISLEGLADFMGADAARSQSFHHLPLHTANPKLTRLAERTSLDPNLRSGTCPGSPIAFPTPAAERIPWIDEVNTMRNLILVLFLVVSVFVSASAAVAQDAAPREEERVETCAGPVVITQIQPWSEYEVTVNGRPILHTKMGDDSSEFHATPIPFILKHVKTPVAPFDEVVVFQS